MAQHRHFSSEERAMALIEVPGGVVDVVSSGAGPDLVLLHSLLIDRSAFEKILPALEKSRRVHLMALPGFDRSSPVAGGVEAYADRVAEALRAMRLGSGAAVLGNGFGGFVAVALAQRHGALFEGLLLVDTAASFPAAARGAFRVMAEKVAAGGMEAIVDIAARRIFHDAYLERNPAAFDERRAVLRRFEPGAFIAACRALERVDLRAGLSDIRKPTLVVVGELDAATPLDLARELARDIPGARFALLPGCGHCPPLEQPDAFLAAVGGFLGLAP
jgi:pimeloyl-ACP methyl ester carboxylesterase